MKLIIWGAIFITIINASDGSLRLRDGGFVVDTGIIYIPAFRYQMNASLAFDGANNFVVWQDQRNDTDADIYGTYLTPLGAVLDSVGIPISIAQDNQYNPSVVFGETDYLVVWEDYRGGSEIYGARVRGDGVVLDSVGFSITNVSGYQQMPAVAFDGVNYFVVWQDLRSDSSFDIYGARTISILIKIYMSIIIALNVMIY